MAKYSYEFKTKVVQAYLSGGGGSRYLANKYGISSFSNVRRWIAAYKKFGPDGLMRSRKNESYTLNFKFHVVELYLTTEVSYQELVLLVGINFDKSKKTNTDNEYLKQLEEENLKLRIENAYLKELRRLRLEETALNKKRESMQLLRILQVKRDSRNYRFSQGNIYVLAKA